MQIEDSIVEEIRQMMYGFGDCEQPLRESAQLVGEIVLQQMHSLLCQSDKVASSLRKSQIIGHEDILFVMRNDKVKLKRLLKYLEAKDIKDEISSVGKTSEQAKAKPEKVKRVQHCMNFLATIDQTGEFSILMDEDFVDTIKYERALRLDFLTSCMDQEQYLKYSKARQASFSNKNLTPTFKKWLMKNQVNKLQLTSLALEILHYTAFETVAQIVDFSLLVKQDSETDPIRRLQPPLICNTEYPSVQMVDVSFTPRRVKEENDQGRSLLNRKCIQPEDIREVIRRYFKQSGPFTCFSRVSEFDIHKRLLCC